MKVVIGLMTLFFLFSCASDSEKKEQKKSDTVNDKVEHATSEVSRGVKGFNSDVRNFFKRHETKKSDKKDENQKEDSSDENESEEE